MPKRLTKNLKELLESRKHHAHQFGHFIDKVVNLCTYGVILAIVGYMFSRLLKSFFLIVETTMQTISGMNSDIIAPEGVIHAVPITIILIKAYKLLLEYAKTQHVSIKYVLEIAITAPVVEIIFNFQEYDHVQLIFMWGFTVVVALIYLYFYPVIKQVEEDYAQQHKLDVSEPQ